MAMRFGDIMVQVLMPPSVASVTSLHTWSENFSLASSKQTNAPKTFCKLSHHAGSRGGQGFITKQKITLN